MAGKLKPGPRPVTLSVKQAEDAKQWNLRLAFGTALNLHDGDAVLHVSPGGTGALPVPPRWSRGSVPQVAKLAEFGTELGNAIRSQLPPGTATAFSELIQQSQAEGRGLIVKIDLFTQQTYKPSPVHSYPWESLIWNGSPLLRYNPVVHVVNGPDLPPQFPEEPKYALVVVTDGNGGADPAFRDHREMATKLFVAQGYKVDLVDPASAAEIGRQLRSKRYDVLYAACHGSSRAGTAGALHLDGPPLTGEDLAELLKQYHSWNPLSLAVFCACESARPGDQDATFPLAPFLIYSGLARQAVGFIAPVGKDFGLSFGLQLLAQKRRNASWANAYFRARKFQNSHPAYWPLARFFVTRLSNDQLLELEAEGPRWPIPHSALNQRVFGRMHEQDGLQDWLRRPEDCPLVFVTGPTGIGKTALALEVFKQRSQPGESEREGDVRTLDIDLPGKGPDEIIWLSVSEVAQEKRDTEIGQVLIRRMLAPFPGSALPSGDAAAALAQVMSRSGLLLLDDWPEDVPFPKLDLGRRWKILVTARKMPPTQQESFLEMQLAPLSEGAAAGLFAHVAQESGPARTPSLPDRDVLSALCGNPLAIRLAASTWARISEPSRLTAALALPKETADIGGAPLRALLAVLWEQLSQREPESLRTLEELLAAKERSWTARELVAARGRRGAKKDQHDVDDSDYRSALAQLESLRAWGLLNRDELTQSYSLPPPLAVVVAQHRRESGEPTRAT